MLVKYINFAFYRFSETHFVWLDILTIVLFDNPLDSHSEIVSGRPVNIEIVCKLVEILNKVALHHYWINFDQ